MEKGKKIKVVVTAAGTAGHVNPALSIANYMRNKFEEEKIENEFLFIGTLDGMELDLVPRHGYNIKSVEAYGFKKEISVENIKKQLANLFSINRAKKILKEFNPDIVIGTGGYICGPVLTAARSLKVPIVLHESNAYPGLAVKVFDKTATKILLGLESAKEHFKYKKNLEYVGNPTTIKKYEYTNSEKNEILEKLGLEKDKKTILVFGGSQGAKKINDTVMDLIIDQEKNNEVRDYQIIWGTGKLQYDNIVNTFKENNIDILNFEDIKLFDYIYNMEEILNICDFSICRSGAMTITELSIVGLPAIFIPLPSRNANKQIDNAKVFKNAKCGHIIENNVLNKDNLNEKIKTMLNSDLSEMKKAANSLAPSNVLEKIYDSIMEIL